MKCEQNDNKDNRKQPRKNSYLFGENCKPVGIRNFKKDFTKEKNANHESSHQNKKPFLIREKIMFETKNAYSNGESDHQRKNQGEKPKIEAYYRKLIFPLRKFRKERGRGTNIKKRNYLVEIVL